MECASDVSIQRRRICCTVIWIGDAQSTYLLNLLLEWEEAQPKNLHVVHLKFQFTALLTQSGINFDIYMHQNLPQFLAETLSPTVLLVFLDYFAETCRRCIWIIVSTLRSPIPF